MSRYEDIEQRLADWLEEGPTGAPASLIAAAIAHARAHPRRRWSVTGHWRTLMSGTNMAQVGPKAPQAGWLYAAAAVLVVVVVVAAGYGILQSTSPGSGVGGAASLEPTATASPANTPTSFTGTESCSETSNGTTVTVDGVVQTRGQQFECTTTNSDPRLAGNGIATMNWDEYPDGTSLAWGTRLITNDDGAWQSGWSVETTAGAGVMEFDAVLVGEGGYEGLVAPTFVRVSAVGPSTSRGTIMLAPPAITGHETCVTNSNGTETRYEGFTAYRGVVMTCTDTMSDSRLSGTGHNELSIDMRSDESADIRGRYVLTNDVGTWAGNWAGTVDVGYTTHRVEALLVGTGEYEGLLYRLSLVSDATDAGYDLTGLVVSRP